MPVPPAEKVVYETPDDDRPSSAEPAADYAASGRIDPYAAFRIAAYRLFIASFILATVSSQVSSSTIKYEVYESSGNSDASLGFIGLAQAVPLLLFALAAGQVVDTFSRKRVLLITQIVLALCPGLLAALYFAGRLTPTMTYFILGVNAVGLTFARPARQALLPTLVPSRIFPNAATWNSSVMETSSVVGPVIGSLFLYFFNAGIAMAFASVCMLGCMTFTSLLPEPPTPAKVDRPRLADLADGVRFVFRTRLMLAAITLDLFAVLLGGSVFMLAPFSVLLGVGKLGYGVLLAAPAVGAVSMALILAHSPPFQRVGGALIVAVAVFGLATIGFGAATLIFHAKFAFAFSLLMLFLTGMADNVSVVIRHTLEQLLTPDAMRGRVSAVNQVFIGSSNDLGGLESGLAAWAFGLRTSVIGGGIGTLIVVGLIMLRFPQLRRLKKLQDIEPASV